MKRSALSIAFSLLLALGLAGPMNGCSKPSGTDNGNTISQEDKLGIAKKAGEAAALAYLSIQKPDRDQAVAIKFVIDTICVNVTGYREGGFAGLQPTIDASILKIFPKEDDAIRRVAATKLSEALLEQLDKLFDKHPEWKVTGNNALETVCAFLDAGAEVFDDYIGPDQRGAYKKAMKKKSKEMNSAPTCTTGSCSKR